MDCRVIPELAAMEKSNVVSERRCKICGVGERARSHPSSTSTSKQDSNIQRDVGEKDDMQRRTGEIRGRRTMLEDERRVKKREYWVSSSLVSLFYMSPV